MSKHSSRTSHDPEFDPRVRALLAAAKAPAETSGPLPGEEQALAAFRTSPQPTRRRTSLRPRVSAKAAMAAAISTGVLVAGVGAAAAGVLPGAVQQTVSSWLDSVGVSIPTGEGTDEDGDLSGGSEGAPDEQADPRGTEQADGHDSEVSETAKNSNEEGADTGKDIAEDASDGRDKSGKQGKDGENHGEPPVSAPNSGGTGTASNATDSNEHSAGAPDRGTETAEEASDGASSDGSGNSPGGD